MKKFLFLPLCLLGVVAVTAQQKAGVFVTIDGQKFSRPQKDSLERVGNYVGIKDSTEYSDTIVYSIFYYPKELLLTPIKKVSRQTIPNRRIQIN